MKILFLTRLYYPHVGGIEKHVEEISDELIEQGHEVTVITTLHQGGLKLIETYRRVKIIRFAQPNIKFLGIIFTWFWMLSQLPLIIKSDIVHIHDVFIWWWPVKILFPNKKVYVTYHGRWGKYPIPKRDIFQKRIGAKLSNGVISIGDYIVRHYEINSDIISYGAVDETNHSGRIIKNMNSFLYVGRLDGDTGLPIFLDMLRRLSEKNVKVDVTFCGDGEMKSECSKYGLVTGWINPQKYLAKSTYFFASGYLSILEALAYRCIVFAGFTTPLQKDYYLLTPFKMYITASDSAKYLTDRFLRLSHNARLRKKVVREGYLWASRQSWKNMVDNYKKLWNLID